MPLTPELLRQAWETLEGDQAAEEPRGIERVLSDLTTTRNHLLALIGDVIGRDETSGDPIFEPGTGLHEHVTDDAEARSILIQLRARTRDLAAELTALVE